MSSSVTSSCRVTQETYGALLLNALCITQKWTLSFSVVLPSNSQMNALPQEFHDLTDFIESHNCRGVVAILGENCAKCLQPIFSSMKISEEGSQPGAIWCYKKAQMPTNLEESMYKSCKFSDIKRNPSQVFKAAVIQDFLILSPSAIQRSISLVSGGGLIILLLPSIHSLSDQIKGEFPRFSSRVLKSLLKVETFIAFSDTLSLIHSQPMPSVATFSEKESLEDLCAKVSEVQSIAPILKASATVDQAQAILQFFDILQSYPNRKALAISSPKGCGKSAVIGLSLASSIALGFSNIFVTSSSSVSTVFKYLLKGFDFLGYKEGSDYEIASDGKQIIRVTVHRSTTRQNVCYIDPRDANLLGQCELLAIDEAATIPIHQLKKLLGQYPTILTSTSSEVGSSLWSKVLEEVKPISLAMKTPIQYSPEDPVEKWVGSIFCSETKISDPKLFPAPESCRLYSVNKDIIFSGTQQAESFLAKIFSLLTSSQRKIDYDSLRKMADNPSYELFAMISPISKDSPFEIIGAALVTIEKGIISDTLKEVFSFEVPNKVCRIENFVIHPKMQGKGYGTSGIRQLIALYCNELLFKPPSADDKALFRPLECLNSQEAACVAVHFDLTNELLRFWRRNGFTPVFVSPNADQESLQHKAIALNSPQKDWVLSLHSEFKHRFIRLLAYGFKEFSPQLCESLVLSELPKADGQIPDISHFLNKSDIDRLHSFASKSSPYAYIEDLVPTLAQFSLEPSSDLKLSRLLLTVLIIVGLQHCTIDECSARLGIAANQVISCLSQAVSKFVSVYSGKISPQEDIRTKRIE